MTTFFVLASVQGHFILRVHVFFLRANLLRVLVAVTLGQTIVDSKSSEFKNALGLAACMFHYPNRKSHDLKMIYSS